MNKDSIAKFDTQVKSAKDIVVVQADNPDGDSLGSALALEAILAEQGKQVVLYCGVDIPSYLRYLDGWDRVTNELPTNFDLSIIVDASAKALFEQAISNGQYDQLANRPCVVLDHHAETANDIEFASVVINQPELSSTCELIYSLARQLNWPLPADALPALMTGILGDTQGLSNQLATPDTYRVMAEMIEMGVSRPDLEEARRQFSKMPESIFRYKGRLIERTEFFTDGKIALVSIPQEEINTYSPLYNPGPLIQNDMLQTEGVLVGVVLKVYADGKVTGMIRCNPGAEIAGKLATQLGGGGHGFAAGFKVTDGRSAADVKNACISAATELLATLEPRNTDETTKHTF